MQDFYKNKKILVTGGCGSIGRIIVKQLIELGAEEIRVFDNCEQSLFRMEMRHKNNPSMRLILGDVRDKEKLSQSMADIDFVFHAAALKHVPLCEYNPFEAVKTNIIGTQNVIESANLMKVKRVLNISTDKAINPVNTLGASKLLSERLILSPLLKNFSTLYTCVRFGNVLDSDGSVIPIFKSQIKQGGPVTITHEEMTRFFMSINDAVTLVLRAMILMQGRDLFILKMDSIRILDLAKVMINILAPKYNINPADIKIKNIGLRPGERLNEFLLTEEEMSFVSELEDMYVLKPQVYTPHYTQEKPDPIMKIHELSSHTVKILSQEEIATVLYKNNIIQK